MTFYKKEAKVMLSPVKVQQELKDSIIGVSAQVEKNYTDSMIYLLGLGIDAHLMKNIKDGPATEVKAADDAKPKKAPAKRFTPPTVEEVETFMIRETGIPGIAKSEAEKFTDYYKGNGWKAGKNPMKDWEATARNWLRRSVKDAVKKVDRLATPDRSAMKAKRAESQAPLLNQGAIEGELL